MDKDRAIARLSFLVQQLASSYRGYLPHENSPGFFSSVNPHLSGDTRTRLALIEDSENEALAIEGRLHEEAV